MSNEHLSPNDHTYDEENYERLLPLYTLQSRVIEEMNRFGPCDIDIETIEDITTVTRAAHFETVASFVIEAAKGQVIHKKPFLLIDDARFRAYELMMSMDLQELYDENTVAVKEAIAKGMREGADHFLRLLVPEAISEANPDFKDVYFLPWRKDLLGKIKPRYKTEESENQKHEVYLPTNLPDICVVHVYPKTEHSLPIEEIRVIPNLEEVL